MSEKSRTYPKYLWFEDSVAPNVCFIADIKWYQKNKQDILDWCKLNDAEHWGNEFIQVKDEQSRLSFELRFKNIS